MPASDIASAAVVVDADLCLPAAIAARAGLRVAPADAPLFLERVNIPRLSVEAGGPLDPAPVVAACLEAVEAGAREVVYVPARDGYGAPEGAIEACREAIEARGGTLHVFETGEGLTAAGWRAVLLAEALAAGLDVAAATARAASVATSTLALVEHPELASIPGPDGGHTTNRLVVTAHGPDFTLVQAPPRREDGLRLVRDGFARATETAGGRLRVAVLHGAVAPAAEAMATWIRRARPDAEVASTAITRHQGTRLGPGYLGVSWVVEPAGG